MSNPFYTQVLPVDAHFCDRTVEIRELRQHALNGVNVVLYSPRRYGKTSLVRRVQAQLAAKGVLTIFADFFGVTSIDDIAAQLAHAVFTATRQRESFWKRALQTIRYFRPIIRPDEQSGFTVSVEIASVNLQGIELLEQTMESLSTYIADSEVPVHIVLDEFQEITMLKEAPNREAAEAFLAFLLAKNGGLQILAAQGQPPIIPPRIGNRAALDQLPPRLRPLVTAAGN